jgi:nicotinamidase/pyrazinamidase
MVHYDERTALLVVDVQNDFADPNGGLYVRDGEHIIAAVNEEIGRAKRSGATVVYTQDWHPPDTPHFETGGGQWPVHCVMGTWGAELHPDLVVDLSDTVIQKGSGGEDGYSGFTSRDPVSGEESPTALAEHLDRVGATKVVVVGLAGDVCVKETALDAARLGRETTVLRAATRSVNLSPGEAQRAFDEMAKAGVTVA